ncbi:Putative vegetatible incompatibility protein HET-E-1 [Planctomycetales bacterium 10988]|nr:Putative vegetatible incompatibility protein HET-E-1 [Planctomycetales bacterium 10988]
MNDQRFLILRRFLCGASVALFFVATSGQPFSWQQATQAEELSPTSPVVSLTATPKAINLSHAHDYRQIMITGKTESGDQVDLTRLATHSGAKNLLQITEQGFVTPLADGKGKLTFTWEDQSVTVPVQVKNATQAQSPSFMRDVMPVLAKLGCNSGTCHGSQDGKNGFQLSLRGYDPVFDHQSLTDDLAGRRFNRAAPDQSLMLLKPAGTVPHEGGVLVEPGDRYYQILREWIHNGVPFDVENARVERIELFPRNPKIPLPGMKQQVRVVAYYPDGTQRDVTAETDITSSLAEVIEMEGTGLASAVRRGEAAILARYEGAYAATTITVMGDRTGYEWSNVPEYNYIDELVYQKLRRVKLLPSDVCTDAEFLRRAYLDLVGLPPTADQVRAFLNDPRDSKEKRATLVEELVGSPGYIEFWTNKWADLLQVNRKYLGEKGTFIYRNWIRQAIASNMPYDQFVHDLLTAEGSTYENPAASYHKVVREPDIATETTTQLFLGVRFNCNKCHDHPFERWTQDQYYQFGAYFAQVGRKKGPNALAAPKLTRNSPGDPIFDEEIVFDRAIGDVKHARTGVTTAPEFPYQHEDLAPESASRREQLAHWLVSAENQYFAKSYVNRIWSYMLGKGIIDPVDDIRAGNPPTNPELLDRLTEEFIASGFDQQALITTICQSRVYQHSLITNQWNEDDEINFSHALPRRLPAETLIDAIHHVTGSQMRFGNLPTTFRAAQLPDAAVKVKGGFLDLFGRPARESPCECERSTGVMLSQALNLINGPVVGDAIADPDNLLTKLVKEEKEDAKVIEEIFLSILNRFPTEDEQEIGQMAFEEAESRLQGAQDLAWALINHPAFLFNR